MTVKILTNEQALERLVYLEHTAGPDLGAQIEMALATDDKNLAKVVELLRDISRYARETALHFEKVGAQLEEKEHGDGV